ncbi:MAG: Nif11-like leader peptide family natural product precursor [Cyanobacteria bacterium P01_A01_bin.114]
MSKKNVLSFLFKAAKDEQLKTKLQTTSTQDEVVTVGNRAGYDFSSEHVDEALAELKQKPGFFGALAEAAIELFSPARDDYPKTGVQPFSGDPNP